MESRDEFDCLYERKRKGLVRCPAGVRGEEAVADGDLEGDEEPEGEAEQAGRDSETAIEWGKATARVSEWSANHHGDQHHARDRANAKDEKICDGPARVADLREDQQSNRGRTCQAMHEANCQGPKKLIEAELPESAPENAVRFLIRLYGQVRPHVGPHVAPHVRSKMHVHLRGVAVNVLVDNSMMLMKV